METENYTKTVQIIQNINTTIPFPLITHWQHYTKTQLMIFVPFSHPTSVFNGFIQKQNEIPSGEPWLIHTKTNVEYRHVIPEIHHLKDFPAIFSNSIQGADSSLARGAAVTMLSSLA